MPSGFPYRTGVHTGHEQTHSRWRFNSPEDTYAWRIQQGAEPDYKGKFASVIIRVSAARHCCAWPVPR